MIKQLKIINYEIKLILAHTSLKNPLRKKLIRIDEATQELLTHFTDDGK